MPPRSSVRAYAHAAEELVVRSERERDEAQLQQMDLREEVEIRHEKGKEKLLARTFRSCHRLGDSGLLL